ncbi:MAG: hypothetical protein LBQ44_08670, partial [Treponema sp.]|nr:hypothetical protein [Treponema sp.]
MDDTGMAGAPNPKAAFADKPPDRPGVPLKKPDWIRVRAPAGDTWKEVDRILTRRGLHTVCDEARC